MNTRRWLKSLKYLYVSYGKFFSSDYYCPRTKYEGRQCFLLGNICLSTWGDTPFSQMGASPIQCNGGVTHIRTGWGTPIRLDRSTPLGWMGVIPRNNGVSPHLAVWRYSHWAKWRCPPPPTPGRSTASTSYAAGGMPLAFSLDLPAKIINVCNI